MDRSDVGKSTTGANNGEGRSGSSTKEEESRILFCRLFLPLYLGVKTVEDGLAPVHIIDHVIQRGHYHLGIDMTVIRQERSYITQSNTLVIFAVIPR